MSEPVYVPVRGAAPTMFDRLSRLHADLSDDRQSGRAPLPQPRVIEVLVGTAFWASLRREEGFWPTISLAWVPPDGAGNAMVFAQPVPFEPGALTRLAPALERPGIHLGVWGDGEEPSVWGATRSLPELCLVVETVEPGLVVVKYNRTTGVQVGGNSATLRCSWATPRSWWTTRRSGDGVCWTSCRH